MSVAGIWWVNGAAVDSLEPPYLFDGVSGWISLFIHILNTVLAVCLCLFIKGSRMEALARTMEDIESPIPERTPQAKTVFSSLRAILLFVLLNASSAVFGFWMDDAVKTGRLENTWWIFLLVIFMFAGFAGVSLTRDWQRAYRNTQSIAEGMGETGLTRGLCLPFVMFAVLTYCWALSSGFNFLPLRGLGLIATFEFSQLLQITAMLTLLSYVTCESIWVAKVITLLCERNNGKLRWDPKGLIPLSVSSGEEKFHLEKGDTDSELKKAARCVHFTARLTEIPNRYLIFPFFVLFLSFIASHTDFDGWAWSQYRWGISLFLFSCCLVPAVVMRGSANRLRQRAIEAFAREESKTFFKKPVSGPDGAAADYLQRLNDIRRGAYAPFLSQPFVLAILTPMGGLGSFALLKLLFSNFF